MVYNYYLEIGAAIFMLIILIDFLTSKQFPILQTKLFLGFLICGILECMIDVASSIAINHAAMVPLWLNEVLIMGYFLLQGITYALFFTYTVVVCNLPKKKEKLYLLAGMIPFIIDLFIVISAPVNKFLYYFDENRQYHPSEGRSYLYLCLFIMVILGVIVSWQNIKGLKKRYKIIIYSYSLICCITLFGQYHVQEMIIAGFGRACIVLLMYLSLQNMGEYKDSSMNIYNAMAFPVMFDKIEKSNHGFAMITIELEKYHKIAMGIGNENALQLMKQFSNKLYKIGTRYHVFHMSYGNFVVLVDSSPDAVAVKVNKIRELFQREWIVGDRSVYLNGNVVVQYYPEQFSEPIEATSLSTLLLEKARLLGNNELLYADEALVAEFRRTVEVEQALDSAIKQKSLEVYYQPIYSSSQDEITSAEALVRLIDEKLGFVSPAEFIPIAEKNGRIIALGNQVLEKTCQFISEKLLNAPDNRIEEIHINISAIQCMQPDMAEQIIALVEKYQVPPRMIYLEVTEQATMSATYLMKEHMRKLGEKGIRFALDDYGTGNSNCSYLIDFSFQKVKFDRSMMQAYFEQENARIILQNEIGTLKKLGISVVVEGIETLEQVKEVEHQKVDYIQGYYFAKPLPETEFLEYLTKWRRGSLDIEIKKV